jgi:hypothetical protein
MRESSQHGQPCAQLRATQLAAAICCAASFLAGQILFGAEPQPLIIWNQYYQEKKTDAGTAAEATAQPKKSGFNVQRSQPQTLKPEAIETTEYVAEEPLPAIISPAQAKPLKDAAKSVKDAARQLKDAVQPLQDVVQPLRIKPEDGGPQLADRNQEPEVKSKPVKLIAAEPLPLDAGAAQDVPSEAAKSTAKPADDDASLPPIVPASAMPRRPAKTSGKASTQRPAQDATQASWMQDIRSALEAGSLGLGRNASVRSDKRQRR